MQKAEFKMQKGAGRWLRLFCILHLAFCIPSVASAQTRPDLTAPSDVAAPPADAEKSASGLASKVITTGTGTEKPAPTDFVTVHYTGWSSDGKMFDSSYLRNRPSTFPLERAADALNVILDRKATGKVVLTTS